MIQKIYDINYTINVNNRNAKITMDETAAKREARRKRIFENSERRLQKITGRNIQNDFEDVSNKVTANIQSNMSDLGINGISTNKAFIEDKNDTLYLQGDTVTERRGNINIKSCFGLNDEDTASALSNSYNYNDIKDDKYSCTNIKSNTKRLDNYNESTEYIQEKNNINYQLKPNMCNKSLLSCHLLSNHISYVVLAAIVNILLICKMDYIFGKSIIVPYLAVMIVRLCTCTNIQEPQRGSFLIAILILCNIKPGLTHHFMSVVSIFTTIVTDLALYIFSFTLIHCAITFYLQDFNILITSNM